MRNKNLLAVLVLSVLAINCSRRQIIESSNPNLDPMPITAVPTTVAQIDPQVHQQWNMKQIGITDMWANIPSGNKKILVAVIGTGIDYNHEDLAGNIFINQNEWKQITPGKQNAIDGLDDDENGYVDDFVGYDFVENDGFPFDRNGMGTAMAGVIAARANNGKGIRGIVRDVGLLPIRYIDGSGHFFFPNLIKSLRYALVMKADVILLHTPSYVYGAAAASFFEDASAVKKIEKANLVEVLELLQKSNVPLIASAGNAGTLVDGQNSILEELLKFHNVTVVTSVDQVDKRPFIANYSMKLVHTSAPGVKVLTTQPGNTYEEVSGTSVAAAHVAGAVALAVTENFGKSSTQTLLQKLIDPQATDVIPGMQFETMGGNRLNIKKYLDSFPKN